MREWVMVALAGGAAAMVFAGNAPGAFWATVWALVRNTLGGSIASLILWGIYTSKDTFSAPL
jgi:uncharacterized membrane protein YjdF